MAKNIVVCSDGTGQVGGTGNNTNVYKTFNIILDRSQRQVSYYDKGIGTGWRKLTGNAFGRGFSKNVLDCYRFIFVDSKELWLELVDLEPVLALLDLGKSAPRRARERVPPLIFAFTAVLDELVIG